MSEARAKLDKLADPKTPPKQEGGDRPEKEGDKDDDDEKERAEKKDHGSPAARKQAPDKDEDEGDIRILWKLVDGSPYQWVFIEADRDEKITAVFGYCWPDKPVPFDQIGDVEKAPIHNPDQAAWDSLQPNRHYRIVANGAKERASQVSISLVTVRTNGVRRPSRSF